MICLACNNTKSKDVELTLEGDILEQFNFVCCLEIAQPEDTQGICNVCVEELKVSFNFKKRCLEIFANVFDHHPTNEMDGDEDETENDAERSFMNSILDQTLHTDDDSANLNISDFLMPFIPEICYGDQSAANTESSALDVSDQTKCRYCFEKFSSKEECQLHLEEHKGDDKPYKCPHEGCDSSFKARKNLKDHFLVHSNERPFPCHFCQQTFKSSSNRSKHERRIHTKERNAMKQAEAKEEQMKKLQQKALTTESAQAKSASSSSSSSSNAFQVSSARASSRSSAITPRPHHTAPTPHPPSTSSSSSSSLVQQQQVNNNNNNNKMQRPSSEPMETVNEKGERVFECEHPGCTSSFRTRSSLRDHQKVHSEERPYRCNYCPSAFKSSSNRSKHERGSHSEQYQKRKLQREAERSGGGGGNNGRLHESPVPPSPKKPRLDVEEQKVVLKHETSDQQNTSNSTSSSSPAKRVTFPCRYCDRLFKKIESRDKHETTHKDFLAYDCGYCYKTFKSDEVLKEHMKIHIEQTKFPCTYKNCTEVFNDRRSLREHKNSHEPEEFICEVETCGRIFSSQKSLKSHKSYTKHYTNSNNDADKEDEDEITCDICDTTLNRNDEQKLAEHLKMHI